MVHDCVSIALPVVFVLVRGANLRLLFSYFLESVLEVDGFEKAIPC